MKLQIKVGTGPKEVLDVVRKRTPPKVGEKFYIRRDGREERVLCSMIKEIGQNNYLYFVDLH